MNLTRVINGTLRWNVTLSIPSSGGYNCPYNTVWVYRVHSYLYLPSSWSGTCYLGYLLCSISVQDWWHLCPFSWNCSVCAQNKWWHCSYGNDRIFLSTQGTKDHHLNTVNDLLRLWQMLHSGSRMPVSSSEVLHQDIVIWFHIMMWTTGRVGQCSLHLSSDNRQIGREVPWGVEPDVGGAEKRIS